MDCQDIPNIYKAMEGLRIFICLKGACFYQWRVGVLSLGSRVTGRESENLGFEYFENQMKDIDPDDYHYAVCDTWYQAEEVMKYLKKLGCGSILCDELGQVGEGDRCEACFVYVVKNVALRLLGRSGRAGRGSKGLNYSGEW